MNESTRDPRRRFNRGEKVAAFTASQGKCAKCGVQLPKGWAGDHVVAHAKNGPTDAANIQAMCPPCNLRKGQSGPFELRDWQRDALQQWRATDGPFLTVATPGSGKTTFALSCLSDHNGFSIIVVPSTRLRHQWRKAALAFGLDLLADWTNGDAIAEDVDGLVVTYATVASQPGLFRMLTGKTSTLVVLDEAHHCGDDQSWGQSVKYAFDLAKRHLLLSGTPFRSPTSPIPFVRYVGEPPTSQSDYNYGYREALQEGVVRSIEFSCFDGTARWVEAGEIRSKELAEADTGEEGIALSSALDPDSDWMSKVMPAAHDQLRALRESIPDAGGLIIARDQWHAKKLAARMQKIVGHPVPFAVSDDGQEARRAIERFSAGKEPWLIAVKMVSEGVDIPRLMVLLYATNVREELFFQQAIGRVVRTRGDESDAYNATVFIPSISKFTTMARDIEMIRDHVLAEPVESGKTSTERIEFELVETLPALDGRFSSTIFAGDDYSDEELSRALSLMQQAQLSGASPVQVARMLRIAGLGKVAGRVQLDVPKPKQDRQKLKSDLTRLVKKYAARLIADGADKSRAHQQVYIRLHDSLGRRSIKEYTIDDLQASVDIVTSWMHDG